MHFSILDIEPRKVLCGFTASHAPSPWVDSCTRDLNQPFRWFQYTDVVEPPELDGVRDSLPGRTTIVSLPHRSWTQCFLSFLLPFPLTFSPPLSASLLPLHRPSLPPSILPFLFIHAEWLPHSVANKLLKCHWAQYWLWWFMVIHDTGQRPTPAWHSLAAGKYRCLMSKKFVKIQCKLCSQTVYLLYFCHPGDTF